MALTRYEKLKRHRQRRRNGRGCLTIEVNFDALGDLLVENGFIAQWDATDRDKLRAALEAALDFRSEA